MLAFVCAPAPNQEETTPTHKTPRYQILLMMNSFSYFCIGKKRDCEIL